MGWRCWAFELDSKISPQKLIAEQIWCFYLEACHVFILQKDTRVTASVNVSSCNTLVLYIASVMQYLQHSLYCKNKESFGVWMCNIYEPLVMQLVFDERKLFQSINGCGDGAKWRHEQLYSDWSAMVLACCYLSHVCCDYTDHLPIAGARLCSSFFPFH